MSKEDFSHIKLKGQGQPENFVTFIEALKSYVKHITATDMYTIMKAHYEVLCLIDEDGNWVAPELEAISHKLLPENMSGPVICNFLDQILEVNSRNEYLMYFFHQHDITTYPVLMEKCLTEGKKVIPDVIGYTIMIENLTKACADDHMVYEVMFYAFREARKEKRAFRVLPLFHKIKLLSVDKPAERNFLRPHRTGVIKPTAGGKAVAINILEATITDWKSGNKGNAKAGWVLAKNPSGRKKLNPVTGAGPSGWSDDGKIVQRLYPLADRWAELYQTWNMDFVTRFGDYPYILPKLFIPQVAGFHEEPKNYIYNRGIALIIYLNYAGFHEIRKMEKGEKSINWFDEDLNRDWGQCNARMADHYLASLHYASNKE